MKEANKQHEKKCPACEKQYPVEDNYCGDDGSALKQEPTMSKTLSAAGSLTASTVTDSDGSE